MGNLCEPYRLDQYYLQICQVVAARSKDPNTQIGCVVWDRTTKFAPPATTRFRRGIRDDVPERLVRPRENICGFEHAERNAICNAARAGTATEGCTIYVEIMPCMDCARAIVQAWNRSGGGLGRTHGAVFQPILQRTFRHGEVLFGEARGYCPAGLAVSGLCVAWNRAARSRFPGFPRSLPPRPFRSKYTRRTGCGSHGNGTASGETLA